MTLTVSHLTFAYPKAPPVLEDVSFTVPAGDFLSVLGANGAGKSTLFRCLLGGLEGYTGAISLDGRDVRTFSRRELAARIAYIPQIHRPTFGYSVLDTALMGLTRHLSPFQSPSKALEQQALTALEQLGVAHLAQRNFAALSGGEQQLVLIARALCQQSELLIMDEPTASLDYGVLALQGGRVAAEGDTRSVLTPDLIRQLYGVESVLLDTPDGAALLPVRGGDRHV